MRLSLSVSWSRGAVMVIWPSVNTPSLPPLSVPDAVSAASGALNVSAATDADRTDQAAMFGPIYRMTEPLEVSSESFCWSWGRRADVVISGAPYRSFAVYHRILRGPKAFAFPVQPASHSRCVARTVEDSSLK